MERKYIQKLKLFNNVFQIFVTHFKCNIADFIAFIIFFLLKKAV